MSAAEREARVNLAAAYRLAALYRWDDLIFTHISARIPDEDGAFLINPFGMLFEEITASSLVKVDLSGTKLVPSPYPVNPAGFIIHSAVHETRPDVGCVLHCHELNGVAVSTQKEGLLPLSQQSLFVLPSLAYHAYEGVALRDAEKARLQADLGRCKYLIMHNHGLLTAGVDAADAFVAMYMLSAACRIQVMAQSSGGELIRIAPGIVAGDLEAQRASTFERGPGALSWPGLLRKLDRLDPSYRD